MDLYKIRNSFEEYKIACDIEGTNSAIVEALALVVTNSLSNEDLMSLNYSIATAYSDLTRFIGSNITDKEKDELNTKSFYHFSSAMIEIEKLESFNNDLFQRIYTNAALQYVGTGRLIKALQLLAKTAHADNEFPMALAHTCSVLEQYAHLYYEDDECFIMMKVGYDNLCSALTAPEALEREGALQVFLDFKIHIDSTFPLEILTQKIDVDDSLVGKNKSEQEYRKWTTSMGLNLNVLNDVMYNQLSAFDNVLLPDMRYLNGDERCNLHFGFFNQIIQEYVSARYLFYDGQQRRRSARLADRNVMQIDLDVIELDEVELVGIVNSHSDFCIRTAFRTLYSLFDKIAFFINEYWEIGLEVNKVSFSSIWRTNSSMIEAKKNNSMLNAIYWISKEFFERGVSTTNPDSQKLSDVRNFMEHRYLAVTLGDGYTDTDYVKHITTVELYKKTLDLFSLCREAIISLAMAVNIEEKCKRKKWNEQGIKYKLTKIHTIPDVFK